MKKRFSLFLVAILSIFALVACSNQTQGDQAKKPEAKKELTASEVLTKMIEKSQNQPVKMEGTIDQKMGGMNNKITMTAESSPNPAVAHINMTFMGMNLEMYTDNQFVYVMVPGQQKWVKTPMGAGDAGASDPMKQLEMIKPLINTIGANKDVTKLEKANGQYVVSIDLAKVINDPAVRQLATQVLTSNAADPQQAQQVKQAMEQFKFDKFKLEYHVDEKTFEVKKYIAEMKAGVQGQTLEQTATFNFSKLEKNVTIPEEVKQAETVQQ